MDPEAAAGSGWASACRSVDLAGFVATAVVEAAAVVDVVGHTVPGAAEASAAVVDLVDIVAAGRNLRRIAGTDCSSLRRGSGRYFVAAVAVAEDAGIYRRAVQRLEDIVLAEVDGRGIEDTAGVAVAGVEKEDLTS